MAEVTASSMHDARDTEDTRLLAAGEHGALIESYFETILQRCRVRCRSEDDALDCAQAVFVRLLAELRRGRRYSVPYRVVVHKVIEWTTKGFYERGRAVIVEFDDDLPEEVFRPADPYADVETRYDLERALAKLRKPRSASPAALKEIVPSLSKRAALSGSPSACLTAAYEVSTMYICRIRSRRQMRAGTGRPSSVGPSMTVGRCSSNAAATSAGC